MAARLRMASLRRNGRAVETLSREMADDAIDRLSFLRHEFRSALIMGDMTGRLINDLAATGAHITKGDPAPGYGDLIVAEDRPIPNGPYDLIVSLGLLDTVNDLPGALALMRRALNPGGLLIASFVGAGSLPRLRAAMFAADADRPAARIHPQVDVRAAGQLMTRIGFASPVVDGWGFDVAYDDLNQLIADLRAQAAGNTLADPGPPLSRSALDRAAGEFAAGAGPDGKIAERFEIVTMSGWSTAPRRAP